MKISQHKNSELVTFSELQVGDVFQHRHHIFMKIKPVIEKVFDAVKGPTIINRNAIRLTLGFCSTFEEDDKVYCKSEAILYLEG